MSDEKHDQPSVGAKGKKGKQEDQREIKRLAVRPEPRDHARRPGVADRLRQVIDGRILD